ncbi:hypothetical protein MSAN_01832700 [Mycena sanguinolenta]|uniref:Uncharacterized protein n=1 Tax=Mycena sanguinolenta TaxID=230812 RepID=A0A8H6XT19_9AGAR|nr:hypothetical protein MSAN_01832700 [Mycena sanguinolenta]
MPRQTTTRQTDTGHGRSYNPGPATTSPGTYRKTTTHRDRTQFPPASPGTYGHSTHAWNPAQAQYPFSTNGMNAAGPAFSQAERAERERHRELARQAAAQGPPVNAAPMATSGSFAVPMGAHPYPYAHPGAAAWATQTTYSYNLPMHMGRMGGTGGAGGAGGSRGGNGGKGTGLVVNMCPELAKTVQGQQILRDLTSPDRNPGGMGGVGGQGDIAGEGGEGTGPVANLK